jgi:hypothetical protein
MLIMMFSQIRPLLRIPSCEMWPHVGLVRTNVLEEHVASILRVERIRELGTVVTSRLLAHGAISLKMAFFIATTMKIFGW